MKEIQMKHDKWSRAVFCFALVCLFFVTPVHAFVNSFPLFSQLADEPDIATTGITTDYDAATGILTASGFASTIATGGVSHAFDDPFFGPFNLEALIDQVTGDAISGSLEIGGTVSGLGFNSGTLLTGTLAGFASANSPDPDGPMQFLFDNLGGDAASLYGDAAGVLLLGTTGLPGGGPTVAFVSDFSNGGPFASADTAPPIPEPTGLALLLIAGLLYYGTRISSRRDSAMSKSP